MRIKLIFYSVWFVFQSNLFAKESFRLKAAWVKFRKKSISSNMPEQKLIFITYLALNVIVRLFITFTSKIGRLSIALLRCVVNEECECEVYMYSVSRRDLHQFWLYGMHVWGRVNAMLLIVTRLSLSRLSTIYRATKRRTSEEDRRDVSLFILKKSAERRMSRGRKNVSRRTKRLSFAHFERFGLRRLR